MPQLMKKPSMSCVGEDCEGCQSAHCYAKGGEVKDHEKGVHKGLHGDKGKSQAGLHARGMEGEEEDYEEDAETSKRLHKKVLGELRVMPKPKLYAEGGSVSPTKTKTDTSTTGNKTKTGGSNPGGASTGGAGTVTITTGKNPPKSINISNVGGKTDARNAGGMDPGDEDDKMKMEHGGEVQQTLGTRIGFPGSPPPPPPDPKNYSEGGSVEDGEDEMDSELHDVVGAELIDALEKKDKKAIMSALHAAIMQCMDKE